jgi:hypothetical protein
VGRNPLIWIKRSNREVPNVRAKARWPAVKVAPLRSRAEKSSSWVPKLSPALTPADATGVGLLVAQNGQADSSAECPLSGEQRKTSARSEYFRL